MDILLRSGSRFAIPTFTQAWMLVQCLHIECAAYAQQKQQGTNKTDVCKGNASLFSNVVWQRKCPKFSILFFETQKPLFVLSKQIKKQTFYFFFIFKSLQIWKTES